MFCSVDGIVDLDVACSSPTMMVLVAEEPSFQDRLKLMRVYSQNSLVFISFFNDYYDVADKEDKRIVYR
jgi:hypothetical protein